MGILCFLWLSADLTGIQKTHRSFRKMTPTKKMKRFASWWSCLHAFWVVCCGLGARRVLMTAGTAGHLNVPGIRSLPGTELHHIMGLLVKTFTRTSLCERNLSTPLRISFMETVFS